MNTPSGKNPGVTDGSKVRGSVVAVKSQGKYTLDVPSTTQNGEEAADLPRQSHQVKRNRGDF